MRVKLRVELRVKLRIKVRVKKGDGEHLPLRGRRRVFASPLGRRKAPVRCRRRRLEG